MRSRGVLGMRNDDVRCRAHVGGGFGRSTTCATSSSFSRRRLVAVVARCVDRDAHEHLLGCFARPRQSQHAAMGFTRDGKIVGVAATLLGDGGAYPGSAP
jgi:CO/xanthine dehydrogenase Mo-binding subunit